MGHHLAEQGRHRGKYKPKKDVPFPPQFVPRHAEPVSRADWHAWFRGYVKEAL